MAKLFLSYSRRDESRARRLTEWLERDGHAVWRDEDDIGGGASFSSEIEKALKDCDAVIVLWSPNSVQSAWVRDEAAFGRDAGKLIPLSIDATEPPLGFRQFQSINLSRWKGHREPPDADRIRRAIARVASSSQAAPLSDSRQARQGFRARTILSAGAAVVAIAAAVIALFLWQRSSEDRQIAIAVLPSPQSPNRAMATDYANVAAADMAAFLPRHFDRATLVAPADASGTASAYRMLISTDAHGPGVNATLTLSDEDGRTTLWSQNWSVADASAADLKADVSAMASKAALCLTDARGGNSRLSQPALGLYLSGCTGLGDTKLSNEEFERMFERVTTLEPSFAPAWDYLALSRAWIAEGLEDGSPSAYDPALQSARQTIAIARKLNPKSAMSYDAEYHLVSNDTFRGLQILEQGARIDPDDGRVQMHLSEMFQAVGRMSDSVQAAQRAIELEPDSPYTRYQYILALVYSGEFSRAKSEIGQARNKWPNDYTIDLADFDLQSRYGEPRAALQLLPKVIIASDSDMVLYRNVIAARMNPTEAQIDNAITALSTRWSAEPRKRNEVLMALGNFGRVDQVYQLLDDPTFQPFIDRDVLFRPDFAAVRADPRFMQIASRLGLVRYWRQSGYWPDFCSNERPRYDCKAEAAKYV